MAKQSQQWKKCQFVLILLFCTLLLLLHLVWVTYPPYCLHYQLLMDKRVGLKRYELDGRKVLFYFDEVRFIQIPGDISAFLCLGFFLRIPFRRFPVSV